MKIKKMVLSMKALCIFACVLSFSSCSQDETVSDVQEVNKSENLFSDTSPFKGVSLVHSSINGDHLVFESKGSFVEISDYIAENYNSSEVSDFSKKLKSLGFISRYEYELTNNITLNETHPDPAIALLINKDGYFQLNDSIYRDDIQERLYLIKDGVEELIATRGKKSRLKLSSSCDPNITGNSNSRDETAYDSDGDGFQIRIIATITYSSPWLGSEKISLTSYSYAYVDETELSTPTFARHSCYYGYDLDLNGVRQQNNGTNVPTYTDATSFTTVLVTSSSICFGAFYVTPKVVWGSENISVNLELR
jgi:hypothetical protein